MTGRNSLWVAAGRWLQQLPLDWLRMLEWPVLAVRGRRKPWVIIVIAPPRSGSTVFYQALVHTLDPVYLSNLWNVLHRLPLLGGLASGVRCRGHRSDFKSSRGFVEGLCGPAEGLRFWEYWFGHGLSDRAVGGESPPPARADYIRRVFGALTSRERPLVTGYVGHTLAISDLRVKFPDAVFLRLRRDPVENALSLLAIRKELPLGAEFSVIPVEWQRHRGSSVHEESAAQVWHINHRISREVDHSATMDVSYEELCMEPEGTIAKVIEFCNARGFQLRMKGQLPGHLVAASGSAHEDLSARRIREVLRSLDARMAEGGRE